MEKRCLATLIRWKSGWSEQPHAPTSIKGDNMTYDDPHNHDRRQELLHGGDTEEVITGHPKRRGKCRGGREHDFSENGSCALCGKKDWGGRLRSKQFGRHKHVFSQTRTAYDCYAYEVCEVCGREGDWIVV